MWLFLQCCDDLIVLAVFVLCPMYTRSPFNRSSKLAVAEKSFNALVFLDDKTLRLCFLGFSTIGPIPA